MRRVIDSSGVRVSALDLIKGLINSVWSAIAMTELFTVMVHTQANQEVNDDTYCSFNLSLFPIWLLCYHSKHRQTWKSLLQTIRTRSSNRSPNELSKPFDLLFEFQSNSTQAIFESFLPLRFSWLFQIGISSSLVSSKICAIFVIRFSQNHALQELHFCFFFVIDSHFGYETYEHTKW